MTTGDTGSTAAGTASGSGMPPAGRWFYRRDGKKSGPVDTATVSRMLSGGELPVDTQVWREGLTAWTAAGEVPELVAAVVAGRAATLRPATPGTVRLPHPRTVALGAIAAVLAACYGAAWLVAGAAPVRVDGVVSADSKPVTGGTVILAPVAQPGATAPGKPAVANVAQDGTYTLDLLPGPGGLAGRFHVRFSPPVLPVLGEQEAMKTLPPYAGLIPREGQVEVREGPARIDIELVPAAPR